MITLDLPTTFLFWYLSLSYNRNWGQDQGQDRDEDEDWKYMTNTNTNTNTIQVQVDYQDEHHKTETEKKMRKWGRQICCDVAEKSFPDDTACMHDVQCYTPIKITGTHNTILIFLHYYGSLILDFI